MGALHIGVAETDITPEEPVWLGGFGFREGPSIGILDRLAARCLTIRDDRTRLTFIACDLIGLNPNLVDFVRAQIGKRQGCPDHHTLLHCTHTHSSPATQRLLGLGQQHHGYERELAKRLIMLADQTIGTEKSGKIAFAEGEARLNIVRRKPHLQVAALEPNPDAFADPAVRVVQFSDESGKLLAVLVNYAMHPVVLGPDNRQISADYPSGLYTEIRNATGAVPFFVNGCAGDLNPKIRGGDPKPIGAELAHAALKALETASPVNAEGIFGARESVVELTPLPPPPGAPMRLSNSELLLEEAERGNKPPGALEYWRGEVEYRRMEVEWDMLVPPNPSMRVAFFRAGDFALLGLACEPFQSYGIDFRRQSPCPATLVAGYCNASIGYLFAKSDAPLGGYEVKTAPQFYGQPLLDPEKCEQETREAAYTIMGVAQPDWTPLKASHLP